MVAQEAARAASLRPLVKGGAQPRPFDALRAIWRPGAGLDVYERAMLSALLVLADNASGAVYGRRSHAELAARVGCSVATCKRVLSSLAARRLIRIRADWTGAGDRAPNAYTLTLGGLLAPGLARIHGSGRADPRSTAAISVSRSDLRPIPERERRGAAHTPEDRPRREGASLQVPPAPPSPAGGASGQGARERGALEVRSPEGASGRLLDVMRERVALRGVATAALAARLASAAASAGQSAELAAKGLHELADRAEDAAAGGCPWSRERVAKSARAWVLGARARTQGERDDRRQREARARERAEALAPLPPSLGWGGQLRPARELLARLGG